MIGEESLFKYLHYGSIEIWKEKNFNKLVMVCRTFYFFSSEKFFYVQFGLNKMYSIVEEMMHI